MVVGSKGGGSGAISLEGTARTRESVKGESGGDQWLKKGATMGGMEGEVWSSVGWHGAHGRQRPQPNCDAGRHHRAMLQWSGVRETSDGWAMATVRGHTRLIVGPSGSALAFGRAVTPADRWAQQSFK
jgi:hypothetical protein